MKRKRDFDYGGSGMNAGKVVLTILVVVLVVGVCGVCSLIASVQSTQNHLQDLKQDVGRGESQYGGALDIVAEKITGVWTIASASGNIDQQAISDLAEAYGNFTRANESGTPPEQVQSALNFNVQAQSLVAAVPELQSAPVFQDALNGMEEAVNEIYTAFQDWQDAVQAYNSYRGKFFMPKFAGDLLGFEAEYPYYEGERERLNIQELMPTAPAQ